jgi:hypothetical protein
MTTPDNEAIVRGLRESLDHNLPADMRRGIQQAIELYTGKPEPRPVPPAPLGPAFTAKVTLNGEPFPHPTTPNPRRPF